MAFHRTQGFSVAMTNLIPLNPANYRRHLIHGENRIWTETNCYVDTLVELLHSLDCEPIAALPFTLCIDFEGDQWTFFKFPHADLFSLYGLEIQELAIWRALPLHLEEQIANGHPVLVELDSYFLPDTAGTAYQLAHVKSTIGANEIDIDCQHLGYFHNQGYHYLEGSDFNNIFQISGLVHPRMLPPYVEFLKKRERQTGRDESLLETSLELFKKHLSLIPPKNPFLTFKERLHQDMQWLATSDIELFHIYSFANLRQYGACFELSATYLEWLLGQGVDAQGLSEAKSNFLEISNMAKLFQFKLARSMSRHRPLELDMIDTMAHLWDSAMSNLLPMAR
jgi:hypothetical protein